MEQAVMNELYYFTDLTGAYVQETISMVSNEILVFGFTALILIVFIRYYLQMLRDTSKGLKTLKSLRSILELATGKSIIKKSSDRDAAQKKLRAMKDDTTFLSAVEKADMLNLWSQINQNFTYEVNGSKIFTTTDFINSFLTFEKFLTSITSRSVLSAPSILTGLGIIGTFLGLSIGVGSASSGLASPDISIARNAMSQLLEGAQLAFITSLAGLFFALVMRLAFTSRTEKIRIAIEEFNILLSTVAIPKDSGISGLASLNKIEKNTNDFPRAEALDLGLKLSLDTLILELRKFSEPKQ
jgi:hypothetical protein